MALITLFLLLGGYASSAISAAPTPGPGPAPGSGDGVPEGQTIEAGPQSDSGEAPGPAPNSGDGSSDGPGW